MDYIVHSTLAVNIMGLIVASSSTRNNSISGSNEAYLLKHTCLQYSFCTLGCSASRLDMLDSLTCDSDQLQIKDVVEIGLEVWVRVGE